MCPICNMVGFFSAFLLVHGFHPAGGEASCISEGPGLAKPVSGPESASAFKKACAPFTDVSPFFCSVLTWSLTREGSGFRSLLPTHLQIWGLPAHSLRLLVP